MRQRSALGGGVQGVAGVTQKAEDRAAWLEPIH